MDNLNKVLTVCVRQARSGGNINVFDLMYETSLSYPELKHILDKLVSDNELKIIDIKNYEFIGDINRKLEEVERQKPVFQNLGNSSKKLDLLAAKQAYLEERRQQIIARMQADENDEEDEELDNKFAEYEKYLNGQLSSLFETKDDTDCSEDSEESRRESLIEFMKELLREERALKPWEEIPEHPSWDNDNDFMRVCAEKIVEIAISDKRMGRQGALKKATALLEDIKRTKNKSMIEVYECIVFELANMSNYYYNKIRGQFS